MSFEVAKSGKALVAAGAGEGLESGVGEKMGLQITAPAEGLAAVDTFVRLYSWEIRESQNE